MNKTLPLLISSVALSGFSASAMASHGHGERDHGVYDYARVIDVRPIVHQVRVRTPVRECWQETVYEERGPYTNTIGPTIVGGLIGGVIGSHFGSGNGRDAMTVAGTLVGSAIGHDAALSRNRDGYYGRTAYPVQRCETSYRYRTEDRIDGYHVTYKYQGRTFSTRTASDPGKRIRVRVDVRPVAVTSSW